MHNEIKEEIRVLTKKYREELNLRINERIEEMATDDNSHFLIYRVLGIPFDEGINIDIYIKTKVVSYISTQVVF